MSSHTRPLSVGSGPEDVHGSTLVAVFQSLMSSRIDFRVRIWETIKTAGLFFGGTLAVTGGIAARSDTPLWVLGILGMILIPFGGFLARWSYVNLWREQRLQLQDEFALYQIEELLGLHREMPKEMQWLRYKSDGSGTACPTSSPGDIHKKAYLFDNKHLPPGDPERKKIGNNRGTECIRKPTLRERTLECMTLKGLLPKGRSDDAVDDYINERLQESYFLKIMQDFFL